MPQTLLDFAINLLTPFKPYNYHYTAIYIQAQQSNRNVEAGALGFLTCSGSGG